MTPSSKKNRVALGLVTYFVCLSLLGLAVYRWSQPVGPAQESAEVVLPKGAETSGAIVTYETLEGAVSTPDVEVLAVENVEPEAPAAPATETSGSESVPTATDGGEEDWN